MDMAMLVMAVLPAAFLIRYIYRKDTVEKEPSGLLVKIFLLGAATTLPAAFAEQFLDVFIQGILPPSYMPTLYLLVENFLEIALIEEAVKYLVLKKCTWKSEHFNYMFDAVVYAVVASLGFAALENVFYLMEGSMATAIARAVFSVPGHAINGVFMGYFYGLAKRADRVGDRASTKHNLRMALVAPMLIHGMYDFLISQGLILLFIVFEIVITIVAVKHVNKLSQQDTVL